MGEDVGIVYHGIRGGVGPSADRVDGGSDGRGVV